MTLERRALELFSQARGKVESREELGRLSPEYDVGPAGSAPPELVREWCERVRTMGPDELSAFDELTSAHWERGSLSDVRHAIAQRRRELGG